MEFITQIYEIWEKYKKPCHLDINVKYLARNEVEQYVIGFSTVYSRGGKEKRGCFQQWLSKQGKEYVYESMKQFMTKSIQKPEKPIKEKSLLQKG